MEQEQSQVITSLEEKMKSTIIGQDEAIEHLNKFLKISVSGLKKEEAPQGVFLLVGPSGVGKTETARTIANEMFGGDRFITTINMSEFQEKHTLSRLIGSPPGYVGYGDGGQLTDPVRVKPYSVVLLDEIEKAHKDIMNLFYQVFDNGIVNDGEGREIDFRNTVIFMTSNLATDEITHLCTQDENIKAEEITKKINPILSEYLKPALLGRMNVIPYKNLNTSSLKKIISLNLKKVEKRLKNKNIDLAYEEDLLDFIVKKVNVTHTGARNIDLVINNEVLPKISNEILDASLNNKKIKTINLQINEDELILRSK